MEKHTTDNTINIKPYTVKGHANVFKFANDGALAPSQGLIKRPYGHSPSVAQAEGLIFCAIFPLRERQATL